MLIDRTDIDKLNKSNYNKLKLDRNELNKIYSEKTSKISLRCSSYYKKSLPK